MSGEPVCGAERMINRAATLYLGGQKPRHQQPRTNAEVTHQRSSATPDLFSKTRGQGRG
jgi:hypothetical protein